MPANVAAAAQALLLVGLIAGAVGLRTEVFRTGALDGVEEGLVFGALWLGIAFVGGLRPSRPALAALAGGVVVGLLLLALPLALHPAARSVVLGHAAGFWPWVVATSLVACAEEAVLRGALWRAIAAPAGEPAALVATSLAFALIHVPIYGPSVVPLDLGVGLILGGLRLWYGGIAAPAAAHLVADLGTWWL